MIVFRLGNVAFLLLCIASFLTGRIATGQDDISTESTTKQELSGAYLVRVPFPLTAASADAVRNDIEALVSSAAQTRPLVVLEFANTTVPVVDPELDAKPESVGKGTPFEPSFGLARWLTSAAGSRVKTIAYLPNSIEGHSVLLALACEEIAAAPGAEIGRAAIDEPNVDKTISQAYLEINQRRQAFPEAVVLSMLDPSVTVVQVEKVDGSTEFVDSKRLDNLRQEGKVSSENEVSLPGQLGSYPANQMRRWRWITYLVEKPSELQSVLKLDRPPQDASVPVGPWKPVVVELSGRVQARSVNALIRAIEESTTRQKVNLVLIKLNSPGGDLSESIRLAYALSELDSRKVRTVAFVESEARGDAAMIAMACDECWMADSATLGGSGDASITPNDITELVETFDELAQKTGRDSVELYASVCPELPVQQFTDGNGRKRYANSQMNPNAAKWIAGDRLNTENGLTAKKLAELKWIKGTAPDLMGVAKKFDVDQLPEVKRGNRTEMFVQRIAQQAWLPPLLLFLAFTLFTAEMNTPGVGILGFASAFCFVAFFWIRFLNGTVEWLEVLLFVCGIMSLAIELFVFPGFGIFGFGGIMMLGAGVVLASQTFILPTNNYQLNQMAWNMSQLASIIVGIGVGVYFIRKNLNHLPVFKRLTLSPAGGIDLKVLEERESIVHWDHFRGKAGTTVTRCSPSGKARIGDDIVNVISDGLMIDEDTPVRVVEVRGNTIVVEQIT